MSGLSSSKPRRTKSWFSRPGPSSSQNHRENRRRSSEHDLPSVKPRASRTSTTSTEIPSIQDMPYQDSSSEERVSSSVEWSTVHWPAPNSEPEDLRARFVALKENYDKLLSNNEKVKADLVKYSVDPRAKYRTSDAEIQSQCTRLHLIVTQTARKIVDFEGYDNKSLQQRLQTITVAEDREDHEHKDRLKRVIVLLEEQQNGKHLQRSAVEMLLYDTLQKWVLPPHSVSVQFSRKQNRSSSALMEIMVERLERSTEHEFAARLKQLENWRLETVLYMTEHEPVQILDHNVGINQRKVLSVLCECFDVPTTREMFDNMVEYAMQFAQLLEKQIEIYFFQNLLGSFDDYHMDFQHPQQRELHETNEDYQPTVYLGVRPALMKRIALESSMNRRCITKGRAVFTN